MYQFTIWNTKSNGHTCIKATQQSQLTLVVTSFPGPLPGVHCLLVEHIIIRHSSQTHLLYVPPGPYEDHVTHNPRDHSGGLLKYPLDDADS